MIARLAISLAAGCASAFMFASKLSGAPVSLVLVCLAPLPLMVAALAWGPLTATIGGIAAASALGAVFGLSFCIVFVVSVALPAWWLGHLALLGRPIAAGPDGNAASDIEWYPLGRILIWIAIIAILSTVAWLLLLGTDVATITDTMRTKLSGMFGQSGGEPAIGDLELLIKVLVIAAPVALPISIMTTLTLSLWLAAKVALTSGRLRRPWPDLRSITLPSMTLVALSAAIGLSFAGGLVAMVAQTTAAALLLAYAVVGFAVLHILTLSFNSRALWLGWTYALTVLSSWPLILMVALGIADALFGLRHRYLQGRPPPLPSPHP